MNQKRRLRSVCRGKTPVLDFDKTMARTDLRSPRGFTVAVAYSWAFERIFDSAHILPSLGGFSNQAPGELAEAAHNHDGLLYLKAVHFYHAHKKELQGLVPKNRGIDMDMAEKNAEAIDFLTELLVRVKLSALVGEIGKHPTGMWPLPVDGILPFLASRAERPWGTITSGHTEFFNQTLDLWCVPRTELVLTDDDMRGTPIPVVQKTKPSPVVMGCFIDLAKRRGIPLEVEDIVFIGDDLRTDGGLAANAGSDFVWYNPDGLMGGGDVIQVRHIDELTEAFA